nr:Fe(3+)-hydroxamate ABC transporter permease FhuB [Ancylobacter crimeensis]
MPAALLLVGGMLAASLALRPHLPGLDEVLLWQVALPRAVIALIAGASLGLSGALLQAVLRNPIADPSTLGIAAGAQLALVLGETLLPGLLIAGREALAFAGGAGAAALVLMLGWKRELDPVTLVISGMMVALAAGALGATLILAGGDYVMSLFIWGAGALNQQGWGGTAHLALRLVPAMLAAALLLRPLAVLGLDDRGARSLGVGVMGVRVAGIAIAVWLAAGVTAEVGVIGFIGLAAPALARLSGARTMRHMLVAAPLAGALILSATDSLVQIAGALFDAPGHDLAPTGAATALIGGPLLLLLLPRLKGRDRIRPAAGLAVTQRRARPTRMLCALAGLVVLLAIVGLTVGRSGEGWHLAVGADFIELFPMRAPRLLAAGAAGAMLAAAGLVLQRLTGNPMAGPEVLGVSAGGGVGLAAALLAGAGAGMLVMAGMITGAFIVVAIMLLVSARTGFGPERLLLAGLAAGSFAMALLSIVLAGGGMAAYLLLVWMSGSTANVGPAEAVAVALGGAVLIAPLTLLTRWMTVLPLGAAASRALGLPLAPVRLVLALLAAALTALASFVVGPLSLVGLMAPHMARLMGFARIGTQLGATLLIGAALLIGADWLSRIVVFPYQVPTGLFAALAGAPYLAWLLSRAPDPQS